MMLTLTQMTKTSSLAAYLAVPVLGGILATANPASAGTLMYSASIPTGGGTQSTNFNTNFTLPKYNLPYELLSVKVKLSGVVTGSARFESLDAASSTITLDLSAGLTLKETTNNTTLAFVQPLVQQVANASAFDGTIDFGGTSGATYTGLTGSDMAMNTYTAPAILALFTGPGNIGLNLNAVGASMGSGAGNLITIFATQAGANAMVTYEYSEPVPEPLTILGSATALGFGAFFKRKQNQKSKKN